MKTYLNDKSFYVVNENKLVYKIVSFESYSNYSSIHWNLELVAGWDYINPDYSDTQGWCKPENFIEDVQSEEVIQYFFEEGLEEALDFDGFKKIEFNENIVR